VNEERLTSLQFSEHEHVRPDGRDDLRKPGGFDEIHTGRNGKHQPRVDRDELRVAAAGKQRTHPVAFAPLRH